MQIANHLLNNKTGKAVCPSEDFPLDAPHATEPDTLSGTTRSLSTLGPSETCSICCPLIFSVSKKKTSCLLDYST